MTLEEVERKATENGHTTRHEKTTKSVAITQGGQELLNLVFCKNRLNWASWGAKGNLGHYIRQLDGFVKQGYRKQNADWDSLLTYDGEEYFTFTFKFVSPVDREYSVDVILFSHEKRGATNFQVIYTDGNRCN